MASVLPERSVFTFHGFKPRFHKLRGRHGHKEEMECDFVLVFPTLIVGLECKSTLSEGTFKKAGKQLDKLQCVLEEELGTGSEFRFVRCVAYQTLAEELRPCEKCGSCSKYLLKFESREAFVEKFLSLAEGTPLKPDPGACVLFKAKVRDLLLFTSKKKKGGDAASRVADAYLEYHELILTTPGEAVFFWNPAQYDIVSRSHGPFAVIAGGTYTHMIKFITYVLNYISELVPHFIFINCRVWDRKNPSPYIRGH